MQSNTLRGIFPERKVPFKRNFIKENVRKIKQIQGDIQKTVSLESKMNPVPARWNARYSPNVASQTRLNHTESEHQVNVMLKQKGVQKLEIKPAHRNNKFASANSVGYRDGNKDVRSKLAALSYIEDKIINRGIQTEQTDDLEKLYASGVIRYPSPAVLLSIRENQGKKSPSPRRSRKNSDRGDTNISNEVINKFEHMDLENKKDFVNYNATNGYKATTNRNLKRDEPHIDPNKPPANYKRGVVPKYIKQKKDVVVEPEEDVNCPAGHILLPEEERRETLRVLRESYADKISELNAMPVRSDTLRMQKRKMELEEELKKIDEGIKVFQRPKVFVKINI